MNCKKNSVVLLSVCAWLSFCNNVHLLRLYDTPGWTWPPRVEIEVGGTAEIFCHMNLSAFQDQCTQEDLNFMDTSTQQAVPKTDITILNETTVVYTLKNAPEQSTTYRCKCSEAAIADTKVFVGHKPHPINDFECRSYDYMRMQCNFTKPDNPVLCKYNLSFHLDSENYKFYPKCNYEHSPLVICEATGIYRANEEIYHYELYAENGVGNLTQRFDVNNTKIMVPAMPGFDFRSVQITTDSAMFSFRMPKYESSYRSKGLKWEVFVKPLNLSEYSVNNTIRPLLRARNEFSLRLHNLKYAYYTYQLRLRVRLLGADEYSEPFIYNFRTAPRKPDRPPNIDVGGFYTDPSETTVHLYWELLQPYEFNGYNFSYYIENQNSEQVIITDSNSASFAWRKGMQYDFKLRSLNYLGLSETFSNLTIPAMWLASKSKTHTTPAVHNIYHEKNGTFTLTWEAPEATDELVDYTVFWCRSKRALLNGCEGSIQFQHVPADVHRFTTAPQEHTLNLAVSANFKNFNTGMHWTECTMNEESDLVKMEPEVEVISATVIKVQWTSEKICPSIFDGYNLSICEVAKMEKPLVDDNTNNYAQHQCRAESASFKIIPKTMNRYELGDLKPFTAYKIEMFMYSMRKVGKTSDPEIVKTFEGAPSQPRQLNVSHITNTSALISWLPPREPNGIIRSYTVVLNNERREVLADENDMYGRITHNLKYLNSSTSYKVYILAHTISNSQPSNDIHFTTLVGYPKRPYSVNVQENDGKTEAKIEWAKSNERTDYYEVAITLIQNDEVQKRRISVIFGSNSCVFNLPLCNNRNHRTTVDVRAVNAALLTYEVDENDFESANANDEQYYVGNDDLSCNGIVGTTEKQTASTEERQRKLYERFKDQNTYRLYKSDWQRGTLYSCSSNGVGKFFLYVSAVVCITIGVFLLFYLMRLKYNKMANIHCTLPAGLDAYISKDFSGMKGYSFTQEFMAVIKADDTPNASIDENNEPMKMLERSNEFHNEERSLLETTSQDSISIVEPTQTQKHQQLSVSVPAVDDLNSLNEVGIASNPKFESNFDLTYRVEDIQNQPNKNAPPPINAATNYIPATDFATTPSTMPTFPAPNTNGYIKPNALSNWQNIAAQPSTTIKAPSGYVTVESIIDKNSQTPNKPITSNNLHDFNVPNNNGYIQANLLEKRKPNFQATNNTAMNARPLQSTLTTATDTYTTLEQLGKMSAALPNTANNLNRQSAHPLTQELGIPLVAPSNFTPGISGYVTPRELTVFGQQQHQQHNRN